MRRSRRRLGAATRSQLTAGKATLNLFRHSNSFRLISVLEIIVYGFDNTTWLFRIHGILKNLHYILPPP